MTKINFDSTLFTLDAEEIKTDEGKPLTLRKACTQALCMRFPDEQNLSGDRSFERGELAHRIHSEKEPKLKIEELNSLKQVTGKAYTPLLVFRIWSCLDEAMRPPAIPKSEVASEVG